MDDGSFRFDSDSDSFIHSFDSFTYVLSMSHIDLQCILYVLPTLAKTTHLKSIQYSTVQYSTVLQCTVSYHQCEKPTAKPCKNYISNSIVKKRTAIIHGRIMS
jgi:hypothetical protein